MNDISDLDREELGRLIKEGFTSGRLDSEESDGRYYSIAWDLTTNKWYDDEEEK